ncbi:LemA family protein [Metamycoplasma buccale]|uniref:LemA family protein n=1 Tax=Metamycoplasma buccale TaxID=55602 RepID=UPI00398EFCA8
MLFDTRTPQGKSGFQPNVDNSIKEAKATGFQKFLVVLAFIFTLGIFWFAWNARRNSLIQKQTDIQEASSLIQAAQKKRRATLIKLLDTVKGYAKHEKETLEKVTALRNKLVDLDNVNDPQIFGQELSKIGSGINVQVEKYPELKADRLYLEFMSEISLQEDEIYSTIRNYNFKVQSFNRMIYTFWTVNVAEKIGAYNQPYFQASEEEMKDVDTSSLIK